MDGRRTRTNADGNPDRTSPSAGVYIHASRAGKTAGARVVSLPLFVYRLAMLAWALWLALAVLRWLKWGWECLNDGGLWRAPFPASPATPRADLTPPVIMPPDAPPPGAPVGTARTA